MFDADMEVVAKWKLGDMVQANVKRPRNYKLLQKHFVMLNVGFDAWEPEPVEHNGVTYQPVKNFDRFREEITILAGYYDLVVTVKGELRKVAKSISFGAMSEDDFGQLYNASQKVLLDLILHNYTHEDLDRVVEELMNFL